MNQKPMAGTFRLDGMLQGPLTFDAATEADFQAWVAGAKSVGLQFHLRLEGGTYSLVADPAVQRISRLKGEDLEVVLRDRLQEFIDLLPSEMSARGYSTIRSEEFRPGTAVQTLYQIGPEGLVSSEQRFAEVDTGEAPPEITAASIRRGILPALVAMLVVLFISTFFVDYRKAFQSARDQIVPLKKDELVVRQEPETDLIEFELLELDRKRNALIFLLTRGSGWESAMGAKPGDAMDWPEFNTLLAIRTGRFRVEFYNKEDKLLVSREIDVRALQKKKMIKVAVVSHPDDRIAKVVLRP